MRKWWREHFLLGEFVLAIVVTATIIVIDRSISRHPVAGLLEANRSAVYAVLVSLWGALLGFSITAVSIVIALAGEARLELLRRSPHYPLLWSIFVAAIRTLSVATATALAALLLDRDLPNRSALVWFYSVFFASLLAVLRVWRVVWVLEKLIRIMAADLRRPGGDEP